MGNLETGKTKTKLNPVEFAKFVAFVAGSAALASCLPAKDNSANNAPAYSKDLPTSLDQLQITPQTITYKTAEGQTVTNVGNFVPMKEVQTERGTLWIPQDDALAARLSQLHKDFPPVQQTVWSQSTNDIVEATAGDEQQHFEVLQLWSPRTTQGEWTTPLFPGDSVRGANLNGTAFAYPSFANPDGSYKVGWTQADFVADMLVGISRRAHFTQIAQVSSPIAIGKPQATGVLGLDQAMQNGWLAKR